MLPSEQAASVAANPVAVELEHFGDYLSNVCGVSPAHRHIVSANLTVSLMSAYVLTSAARTLSETEDQLKAELVSNRGNRV